MNGYYFAIRDDNFDEKVYLGNGVQIKYFLDLGMSIYSDVGGNEILIASPTDTFYENAYAETGNGDILIASPESGWIGV